VSQTGGDDVDCPYGLASARGESKTTAVFQQTENRVDRLECKFETYYWNCIHTIERVI
jgi:hypothetical protein